ncbi:MAG: Hpt domain-containing protein [Candidatus Gastranaerophilales bacterium]|nr:Hpt domain-containing protein [Candidatus Gastranaerophilales bacterium]
MADLKDTIKMLRRAYLKKLEKDVVQIEEYQQEEHTMQTCLELLDIVHKITGTGGMYGFKNLYNASSVFEEYLLSIKKQQTEIEQDKMNNYLDSLVSAIHNTIEEGVDA